jgi:hypothetical protein
MSELAAHIFCHGKYQGLDSLTGDGLHPTNPEV